ncbi:glycosyltransferase family 4 protein [Clostridium chauvoei]|uniref:Glycosyl transferase n=2 Tax=Clostridium chauvoei TaxID=46867 RepID=A0A1U6JPS0_9CLOT|nr:glycosyltransferase family 1 protein [Clostridium chauvoei]ATD55959.1 glycosyl transferase [Clostridium chauvoei]ATD56370.1 glycosyl transferase [Clostridium chauvoei]MBX7281576.1 glycosyltransferase family 4 protein [Clostridium chauvoei]MBX7284085.1 glycosyltransferase family 4 protein [Clostridium chauvoei]MBX7286624.1 glycosyltransferase family 4 protein [Clostridium chauvoei]
MKISIDARGINMYKGTGIGTYTENVVTELLNIDKDNDYTLFWTGEDYNNYKNNNSKIVFSSRKHGRFYENFYFPNYIKDNEIDLHHIPQNGIGLTDDYKTNCVVTIHDLIPYLMPETVGKGYLERFLRDMPKIINQTKGIITVSEYSKRDILRFFNGFPEDKIFVTPLAANSSFKPLDKQYCKNYVKENFKINNPYILYIGGFSTRKNVRELILAFNNIKKDLKIPHTLLLGGAVKDEGQKLVKLVKDLNIEDSVAFTGFIDSNVLPILYNGAEVFAYPSLYEGFGLPPLEAMSCQTAVITSNLTSIPEVTGDTASLINPFDKDELAKSLIDILNNDDLKNSLALKGYKRSLQFSWRHTANNTLKAYESIFNSLQ